MNTKKQANIRKCVVTQERHQKNNLIRVVRQDALFKLDVEQILEGRGAYITADVATIEQAKKKNAFARALRMKVETSIYDDIIEFLNNK